MIEKIVAYFMLVFVNWYFLIGVGVGFIAKYSLGGKATSLVTGVVIGMFIFDLIRHGIFK